MSYVLSVYSTKAFKEYLLPAVNNADFQLVLQCGLFGFPEDVEISMEILDRKWKIIPDEECSFTYAATREAYAGAALKNGDILSASLGHGGQLSVIVKETDSSFTVYEKFSLANAREITIGKGEENTFCYDNLGLVSKQHARIARKENFFVIQDSSANGLFVNGRRVVGASQLHYGDCIDIFGLRLVYLEEFLAVNTTAPGLKIKQEALLAFSPISQEAGGGQSGEPESRRLFHRSPRNIPKIETEKIEIEAPPAPRELNAQPTFMAIGPSMTMALPMLLGCAMSISGARNGSGGGAFMYTGLVTAVGSALIGCMWSLVNIKQARKKNREDELKRFEAYSEYLIHCADTIKTRYENNSRGLRELYPEAGVCCGYNMDSVKLWDRNTRHKDFLCQRLGLGSLPFQAEIDIPKERFNLINDSLAEKPKMMKESYRLLHDVPICIDLLKHRVVGIVGGEKRRGCYPVMYNLAAQIAASNCYTDVKMAFVYDENQDAGEAAWNFAKWLPHVWAEDKKTRFVAGNKNDASEVFYEITKVLRMRAEERGSFHNKEEIPKPYYILFLENAELLEDELISRYIYDTEENVGITTVLMVKSYEELPNACEYIIENTPGGFAGMYGVADGEDDKTAIRFDILSPTQLENFSRRLSYIEVSEVETGGEIPGVLTFFDMYGIQRLEELDVMERWKKNRTYESIKALVGQRAGGVDCYLDVHEKYHGPHGLVAGTTGSGKSETLQTYMLSLALNYSPDDIGFFVIDYKGGGMANLFEGLPHMIGQISNLSGNQVHRAMVSIKSENLRRQRIFNEHGVNNINLYTRLYKNNEAAVPVPHMFIIIDEFAELKREEPDFMRELISVAQVGRSLGVHLILATQKPSGTVDDNIWSNSRFRLCLRVQDRQDSMDMLHKPDAAYITQAGRCYLQVGNDELFELFQSAWSGAVYDEEAGSVQTDIARMLSGNGRAALVGSHTKRRLKERMKRAWVAQLLEIVSSTAGHLGMELDRLLADRNQWDAFVKGFFQEAAKAGIEYPESDYNTHRVKDLLEVYAQVRETSVVGEQGNGEKTWQKQRNQESVSALDEQKKDGRNLAARVMALAEEKGRKLPEMKEKTQLDAVVEYLAGIARENGYVHNLKLWLPVLPVTLYLEELEGYKEQRFDGEKWPSMPKRFSLETMVGLYDDPVNQAQRPLTIDVAVEGNCAVVGTVVSGKSTFLMTYLYALADRYSPEAVNIYVLDFSSGMLKALEGLPHAGGVMTEKEGEKVSKFFTMMEGILEERKELFQGGNYSQYLQAHGPEVPAVVIAIDNMAAFRSKTNGQYEEFLMTLVKEGAGYGIFLMVTAAGFGINEISNSMGENFRNIICLEMNDRFAYTDALRTLHLDVLPEENVKGRGLAHVGDSILEFQTALTLPADDDYERGELVKARNGRMNAAWKGKKARAIPSIPEKPLWQEFARLEEVQKMADKGLRLPIGYDRKTAMVYGINLSQTYCYLISGRKRSGKTNALRIAMMAASMMGGQVAAVDFSGNLKAAAEAAGAEHLNTTKALFDYFMKISPTFKERNAAKRDYAAKGMEDEDIFQKMQQFPKLFIFIDDLPEFVQKVHNPGEGVGAMAPFVSTLLEKGAMHNVFWIAGFNQEDAAAAAGFGVYNLFVKDKNGMHLGGNVAAQRLLEFGHLPYQEQGRSQKPGIAMLPAQEEDKTTMVVLPFYTAQQGDAEF